MDLTAIALGASEHGSTSSGNGGFDRVAMAAGFGSWVGRVRAGCARRRRAEQCPKGYACAALAIRTHPLPPGTPRMQAEIRRSMGST